MSNLSKYLVLLNTTKCSKTYKIDRSKTPELEFIEDMRISCQHKFLDTITVEKRLDTGKYKITWTMLNGASYSLTEEEYKDPFLMNKFNWALRSCLGVNE